ncbi:uncharacterized protein LOC107039317 [Diachasma alloeum]|uniref:uncharacterized protein LOC107039317 n=1 Tax=Diachasma alloeum TaxID=454923 RepID=UPI0007383054|nr:uncharacterized protein LOC107039317 [Diachasma alloeum]
MSDVLANRDAWKEYEYNREHQIYSNFTPFYVTVAIFSIIGGIIFIFNIICCSCSRYKHYWRDRHTGNRWIHPLWVVTPHKNPPLDLTPIRRGFNDGVVYSLQPGQAYSTRGYPSQGTHYSESVQGDLEAQYDSRLGTPQPQEYMELHKRESEI